MGHFCSWDILSGDFFDRGTICHGTICAGLFVGGQFVVGQIDCTRVQPWPTGKNEDFPSVLFFLIFFLAPHHSRKITVRSVFHELSNGITLLGMQENVDVEPEVELPVRKIIMFYQIIKLWKLSKRNDQCLNNTNKAFWAIVPSNYLSFFYNLHKLLNHFC